MVPLLCSQGDHLSEADWLPVDYPFWYADGTRTERSCLCLEMGHSSEQFRSENKLLQPETPAAAFPRRG